MRSKKCIFFRWDQKCIFVLEIKSAYYFTKIKIAYFKHGQKSMLSQRDQKCIFFREVRSAYFFTKSKMHIFRVIKSASASFGSPNPADKRQRTSNALSMCRHSLKKKRGGRRHCVAPAGHGHCHRRATRRLISGRVGLCAACSTIA